MQPSYPDFLIIGGGIMGLLTARELAGQGASVNLLDKSGAARESSWAGGGILSPLNPWRYPDAVTALAAWGQPRFQGMCASLAESTGIDPQWMPCGMLSLDPRDETKARNWARRWGYSLDTLNPVESQDAHREVRPPERQALYLPQTAQVRTPRFGKALRALMPKLGVRCLENVRVTVIRAENGHALGVETTQGRMNAGQVILAAGAWSAELAQSLCLRLGIRPIGGQMLLYKAPRGLLRSIVLCDDRYLIPRRDGRILIGSTLEETGFDKHTTATARTALRNAAVHMLPALQDHPIEHHWAGLRPGQSGSIPWIGEHPRIQGLWINSGHFRNGVVLSLGSARLLADLILGLDPILPPKPYAWRS